MAEPNLDELNVVTRKQIMPNLADLFFRNGPLMRFVKEKRMKLFKGGTEIQENFIYKPMKGGPYAKGQQFNTLRRQTKAGMSFQVKKYYMNITEFTEDIEVEMRTPEAVFDMVRVDLANAALSLSAMLEIDLWKHGQNLSGVGGEDRSLYINGFEEATARPNLATWSGAQFTSYGTQSKVDGAIGNALNPAPAGLIADDLAGTNVTNRVLEHSYMASVVGGEHPKLGVTSNRGMAFINENYQGQQRLVDTVEPTIGWAGMKFKQATLIESQYIPGQDGENDPDLGNYLNPNGELLAWLNPGGEGDDAYFRLHVSSSPKYQFGFTGFKVAQDSTQVCGQILLACNFIVRAPRYQRFLFNIKG